MIEIERPGINTVEQSENGALGVFEVEPLERGFGITLGKFFDTPEFDALEQEIK